MLLDVLGLTQEESFAYRELIAMPSSTPDELGTRLNSEPADAARLLSVAGAERARRAEQRRHDADSSPRPRRSPSERCWSSGRTSSGSPSSSSARSTSPTGRR